MATLSSEIKGLLQVEGVKQLDLQVPLGMTSKQSVANKFARNSWSVEDLVKVVDFLGGKLVIKVDSREIESQKIISIVESRRKVVSD